MLWLLLAFFLWLAQYGIAVAYNREIPHADR